jgi:putative membrane protein
MRHLKLVILILAIVIGTAVLIRIAGNDPSVRGQDANVETRGTNHGGVPIVGTSGSTDTTAGFVMEAAEMNGAEVALAVLAARNASSESVRAFAAELERDHKAAAEELKSLAERKSWAFPQSLDSLQTQALQGLQQARGPEFDRAFIDAMITSHEKAIAVFRAQAQSATDPDLRAFAQKQLPTLENHLTHARSLK